MTKKRERDVVASMFLPAAIVTIFSQMTGVVMSAYVTYVQFNEDEPELMEAREKHTLEHLRELLPQVESLEIGALG